MNDNINCTHHLKYSARMDLQIPVVTLGLLNTGSKIDHEFIRQPEITALGSHIVESLQKHGLIFIQDHGISDTEISHVFELGKKFFTLPHEKKAKYERKFMVGWRQNRSGTGNNLEGLPHDYKESFAISNHEMDFWPKGSHVPMFRESLLRFTASLEDLCRHILRLLAVGLGLQDIDFFNTRHNFTSTSNLSDLRMNYYPSLGKTSAEPGQMRFAEHTDETTFTLVIQDGVGGYEVKLPDGSFAPVKTEANTILLSVGDYLQRWTTDKLISPIHRVIIPENTSGNTRTRQSMAFFVIPDNDKRVETIDGSDKYEPVYNMDYRFSKRPTIPNTK